jgi:hypothetical protein
LRLGCKKDFDAQTPSTKSQTKSSKLQTPNSKEASSIKLQDQKTDLRTVCPGFCFGSLEFDIWNFSGAWGLGLGVSLNAPPSVARRWGLGVSRSNAVLFDAHPAFPAVSPQR